MPDSFPDDLQMPVGSRYTARYPMALAYAAVKHAAQVRKDTSGTPYIAHPMAVSVLVWQHVDPDGLHAADLAEDLAIAALLHDVAEDAGGVQALNEIEAMFGSRVAEIVDHCSDATPAAGQAKDPWRGRKEAHIARVMRLGAGDPVSGAPPDAGACLVIACDKLHNLSDTVADFRRHGEAALDAPRFNGGVQGTRWYYRTLRDALAPALPGSLLAEIDSRLIIIGAV